MSHCPREIDPESLWQSGIVRKKNVCEEVGLIIIMLDKSKKYSPVPVELVRQYKVGYDI